MKLPPNVKCIEDVSLLIWRPLGILNEAVVNEILAFLDDRETKLGKEFDRFTDLSGLDAVDLSFKFVFQVALFRRLSRMGHGVVKSAFFVTAPEVARYVKVHALVTDHSPLGWRCLKIAPRPRNGSGFRLYCWRNGRDAEASESQAIGLLCILFRTFSPPFDSVLNDCAPPSPF